MTMNDLVATYTVEHKGKLYFRVEIFHIDTGAVAQERVFFSEVYLLRYPNGTVASKKERMDSSFRQSWLYLDDLPTSRGSTPQEVRTSTNEAIIRYGDDYLARFDSQVKRQR